MILLSGKVGYCQLFQPPYLTVRGLSFYIMSLVRKGRGLLYFNVLFEGFVRKSSSFSFLLSFKYVQIIIFPFVSPCCGKVDKNTLQGTGRELSAAKFIQDVSESQFGKIKSLEGDWYLVDDTKILHL